MQSFVLDRHTDPNDPTLKVSQNDKIPVYENVDAAEADLTNLEDGQLLATKDMREIINVGRAAPITISQSSSINTIQFDTRFIIDAASAITVTLGSALYAGCTVTIINANAIRHTLAGTFLSNRIPPVMANCIITLVWNGSAWQMLSYQDNGYSTDETFTGKFWTDGKPIYCRSSDVENPTNNTVLCTISDLDHVIKMEGSYTDSSGWYIYTYGYSSNYISNINVNASNQLVYIKGAGTAVITFLTATIEYTKTTG